MCGVCSSGSIHERIANDPFIQGLYQTFTDYARIDPDFRSVLSQKSYQNYSSFVGTVLEQSHSTSCEEPDKCFLNAFKEAFGILICAFVVQAKTFCYFSIRFDLSNLLIQSISRTYDYIGYICSRLLVVTYFSNGNSHIKC